MQSLRDKLLKAGLVSEEAAKKSEAEKKNPPPPPRDERPRREAPTRREGPPPGARHAGPPASNGRPRFEKPEPRIPKLPPLAGSKEANRLMSRKQLELDKAIREKVLANQVAVEVGATTFYFVTRKNKLRRLELTAEQAKLLETGALAVVERPDPDKIEHALVAPAIAEELLALSPRAVRFLNKAGAQVGFLSEAEIGARANEAESGDTADVNEADPEPSRAESSEPGETFITIKRAPKP